MKFQADIQRRSAAAGLAPADGRQLPIRRRRTRDSADGLEQLDSFGDPSAKPTSERMQSGWPST